MRGNDVGTPTQVMRPFNHPRGWTETGDPEPGFHLDRQSVIAEVTLLAPWPPLLHVDLAMTRVAMTRVGLPKVHFWRVPNGTSWTSLPMIGPLEKARENATERDQPPASRVAQRNSRWILQEL